MLALKSQWETAMHAAIAEKRQELIALCRRYGVTRLEVFGSAARAADFDPVTSDADFLVEFAPQADELARYFDFKKALEFLLARPVDLVEFGTIKNPFIRAGINRSRELVYVS
jgi:predicted nucleotidyltransferase